MSTIDDKLNFLIEGSDVKQLVIISEANSQHGYLDLQTNVGEIKTAIGSGGTVTSEYVTITTADGHDFVITANKALTLVVFSPMSAGNISLTTVNLSANQSYTINVPTNNWRYGYILA